MLTLTGTGKTHNCNGITRRDFMQVGTLGAIGLSLPQYYAAQAAGAAAKDDDRACVMIFNLGAPSHLDTFDMKPEAPAEIRGPFQAIDTAAAGVQVSEILPMHARVADKFSFVRSAHHGGAAVHDAGWQMMQTGRLFTGGVNTPHAGAVVSYLRGRKTDLPAFAVLPQIMGRGGGNLPNGQAGGFLGKAHDPFVLNADPSQPNFKVPDLLPPADIGTVRLERRRKMRDVVDETVGVFEASENAELLDDNFEAAFRMMSSPQAREAFDLSKEPQAVRERYGMTRFGQCCLLARRLIENGVRFVTINTFLTVFNEVTWDIHGSKPFTSIAGMKDIVAPLYDRGYSALIEDLDQRGMLDKTLVCNLAEFGRTPRVNPAGGRDHWPQCFTVYFAGGGVKGGQVVGASDPIGGVPADRPVGPPEIAATVFHSLGFDLEKTIPGPAGRPFPLVDFGHREIHELF
ncbi:MAG: DUF1501 domain-containing protein [Planctomycetota bacterium]|mgnify:CR=1 FL=1|nr:MAG: DUF1501 domain-containing protein [Planctomycetota bacterium]REK31005.1 MAG: DUF1501 domain-containing protein [Planctomycetota bacterium]REK36878.1 MAG: DUF1501 domain-containing protein [Planctomycetota bacterium]